MKYIRADLFMNKIAESAFFSAAEKGKIRAAIEEEPSEDVKPVEHAHWIREFLTQTGCYECSSCRRYSTLETNYCGSCGAKMDEETEK